MKLIFHFLLFAILFNIASITIAATGFFGSNVLYSDLVSDDPNELISAEEVMEKLFTDPITDDVPGLSISIPFIKDNIDISILSWATLTTGILTICFVLGFVTKSTPTIVPAGIVGSIFLLMYANSRSIFDEIQSNLHNITEYVILMVAFCFLYFVIIAIMDYISGQSSGEGKQ